MLTSKLQG